MADHIPADLMDDPAELPGNYTPLKQRTTYKVLNRAWCHDCHKAHSEIHRQRQRAYYDDQLIVVDEPEIRASRYHPAGLPEDLIPLEQTATYEVKNTFWCPGCDDSHSESQCLRQMAYYDEEAHDWVVAHEHEVKLARHTIEPERLRSPSPPHGLDEAFVENRLRLRGGGDHNNEERREPERDRPDERGEKKDKNRKYTKPGSKGDEWMERKPKVKGEDGWAHLEKHRKKK